MRMFMTLTCLAFTALIVSAGCSSESPDARGETATYTTRGQVVELKGGGIKIHHETIDEFVASDGEVMPMKAHEMPFLPAEGVSLDGIQVGDKVEFSFDVWWQPAPGYELTRITKLPDDAELDIEPHDAPPEDHTDHTGHAH